MKILGISGSPRGDAKSGCYKLIRVVLEAQAAQQRKESRGVHYRGDYPERNDKEFAKHIELARDR